MALLCESLIFLREMTPVCTRKEAVQSSQSVIGETRDQGLDEVISAGTFWKPLSGTGTLGSEREARNPREKGYSE